MVRLYGGLYPSARAGSQLMLPPMQEGQLGRIQHLPLRVQSQLRGELCDKCHSVRSVGVPLAKHQMAFVLELKILNLRTSRECSLDQVWLLGFHAQMRCGFKGGAML